MGGAARSISSHEFIVWTYSRAPSPKRPRLHRTQSTAVPDAALVPGFNLEPEFIAAPNPMLDRPSEALRVAQQAHDLKHRAHVCYEKGDKMSEQIVIGTPGKVLGWMREKQLNCATMKILVFDEADQMMDTEKIL